MLSMLAGGELRGFFSSVMISGTSSIVATILGALSVSTSSLTLGGTVVVDVVVVVELKSLETGLTLGACWQHRWSGFDLQLITSRRQILGLLNPGEGARLTGFSAFFTSCSFKMVLHLPVIRLTVNANGRFSCY